MARSLNRLFLLACLSVCGCAVSPRTDQPAGDAACAPLAAAERPLLDLSPYDSGLPQRGQWRDGFVLADIDGDAAVDLVHGPPRKSMAPPIVFSGDGLGGFRQSTQVSFPPLAYDYGDVAAGDLDGDGRTDLVFSAHLRGLAAVVNETRGHFAPWGEGLEMVPPAAAVDRAVFASRAISLVDWNGDGRPDLVAANEGPTLQAPGRAPSEALRVYLNRDRYWQLLDTAGSVSGFSSAIATGDLNGDGKPEAIVGSSVAGNRRLLHVGFGGTPQATHLDGVGASDSVSAVTIGSGTRATAFLGILERDDTRYCARVRSVRLRASGGADVRDLLARPGTHHVRRLLAHDLDGDGRDDLVVVFEDGALTMLRGSADGFVADASAGPPEALSGCQAFDAGLVTDADGGLALLVSYAGEDGWVTGATCPSGGGFASWRVQAGSRR